ncbi:hypothetical protein WAX88_16025 [Photobacterium damselae subsp. damselae]|uniref:hypothetical protein n=1 Tax=Photobacterium damselae TaxID=38293 RepID=UPI00311B2CEB
MGKNRFSISTVFDFDGKKFDRGIRAASGSVNTFARKTANRFNQAAHSMVTVFKKSGKAAGKGFSQGVQLGMGSLAVGAMLNKVSEGVLERKYKAQAVGLDTSTLDSYGLAAKKAGLQTDNVADLVEEMHNKIGMSKIGTLEAGVKDFAQALHLSQSEFKKIQKMKPEKQFKTIFTMLNKLDRQAAIGVADSMFGGEGNRLYRIFRDVYGGQFEQISKEYNKYNLLTNKGRKGNEDFAQSYGNLTYTINSAVEDTVGALGNKLTPVLDYAQNKFSEFYRYGVNEAQLFSTKIDEYFGESSESIKQWGSAAIAAITAVGSVWAAKKIGGTVLNKAKDSLGLPDKDSIQKVYVVNMSMIGGGGGGDSEQSFDNTKDLIKDKNKYLGSALEVLGLYPVVNEIVDGLIGDTDFAKWAKKTTLNDIWKSDAVDKKAAITKSSVPIATPTGGVTHAAGFGDGVSMTKTESLLERIASSLEKVEVMPSGDQQKSVITPFGMVNVSSTSEY